TESGSVRLAREAAAWLTAMERPVAPDGLAWAYSSDNPSVTGPGIDGGASGVGFFLLRLYRATGETAFLEKAKKAANYVAARSTSIDSYDWLNGAAGCGEFLLAMHSETGDERYVNGARAYGDWLIAHAIVSGDGVHWTLPQLTRDYTGLAHGPAGVGIFLLDLYQATREQTYLDYAKRAWNWTSRYSIDAGTNAITWKRLTTDKVDYPGWCGGSTGILFFLHRLYDVTGDAAYRDALIRTANGFLATAIDSNDGRLAWRQYGPSSATSTIYCHGVASVAAALEDAFVVTSDARYRDAAVKAAAWIDAAAAPQTNGLSWHHDPSSAYHFTGFLTGTASIGHTYLRLYRVEKNPAYLQQAHAAAAFLESIADHPAAGQSRWLDQLNAQQPGDTAPAYQTGWYEGAAGIGLFLLELDEADNGSGPSDFFSGVNP